MKPPELPLNFADYRSDQSLNPGVLIFVSDFFIIST